MSLAMGRVAAELRVVRETGWDQGHPTAQPLWTFVAVEGVEPTHNAAEQALRPAVL